MKTLLFILVLTAASFAGPLRLQWDPYDEAVEQTNGFTLRLTVEGQEPQLIDIPDASAQSVALGNLPPGTYTAEVRAYRSETDVSVWSEPLAIVVRPEPKAPSGMTLVIEQSADLSEWETFATIRIGGEDVQFYRLKIQPESSER